MGLLPTYAPQPDLRGLYFNAPAPPGFGAISAPKRSVGQTLHDYIADKARNVLGKRMADKVASLPDFTPVGSILQGFDAGASMRGGDWLGGGLGALMAVAPVPGPEKRLLPAVRVNGKVFAAPGTHFDALDQLPAELRRFAVMDGNNRGFVTEAGKFLDRRKAASYAREHNLFAPDAPSFARESPELIGEWLSRPRSERNQLTPADFWQALGD